MTSQFELSNAHIFFWENYYTTRQTFLWLSIKIPFQWYIIWPIFVKKISNLKKCWRHQKSHFFWWICQKKFSEHHNECLYQFSCFGHHLQYSAKIFPNCPHYIDFQNDFKGVNSPNLIFLLWYLKSPPFKIVRCQVLAQ